MNSLLQMRELRHNEGQATCLRSHRVAGGRPAAGTQTVCIQRLALFPFTTLLREKGLLPWEKDVVRGAADSE